MAIDLINSINTIKNTENIQINKKNTNNSTFSNILKKSIDNINENINNTEAQIENLIAGNDEDFHKYIINTQKTEISLQLTLKIRDKVVDAYQEIMRMQV